VNATNLKVSFMCSPLAIFSAGPAPSLSCSAIRGRGTYRKLVIAGGRVVGEAASNWRDNTASQNMFLNIFVVHHNSTAATEHGSDFRNPGERS
jgi:hypothetical protein